MVVGYVNEIPSLSLVATFVEPMLATFVWIRRLGSVVRQPLLSTRWSDARTWKVEYLMERDVRVEKGKEKTLLSLQVLAAQLLLQQLDLAFELVDGSILVHAQANCDHNTRKSLRSHMSLCKHLACSEHPVLYQTQPNNPTPSSKPL